MFQEFAKTHQEEYDLIQSKATYRRVKPLFKNVKLSYMKLDQRPQNPKNKWYLLAVEYAWRMMAPSLVAGIAEICEIVSKASPGIPFTWEKLFTKEDALNSKLFKYLQGILYIVIWATYTKDEFLPMEDLLRDKVRTMFGPDLLELMWQKFFFDGQNQNIIDNNSKIWIKYGMCKQYGGFSDLMKSIEKFPLRFEGDLSGYDRVVDLTDVYELRTRGLVYPPQFTQKLASVIENLMHSIVLLPNGDLVELLTGNRSGSNNTAADNSIKHLIIKFYQLIRMRVDKGMPEPSYAECLMHSECAIYSDDFIQSFDDVFFPYNTEELDIFMRDTYKEFGLELKPTATYFSYGVGKLDSNHSFLGSYAKWDVSRGFYLPTPRVGKICSSLLFEGLQKLQPFDHIIRVLTLTMLSSPDVELFNAIRKYFIFLYDKLGIEDRFKVDDYLQTVQVRIESRSTFMLVMTGREMGESEWKKKLISEALQSSFSSIKYL